MFATTDLNLLRDNLQQLLETAYFNKRLEKYTQGLISVVDHVLRKGTGYPEPVVREFSKYVWSAHQYLSGSVTKEVPYELEYSLQSALSDWMKVDFVITTALTSDLNFHFQPLDPWGQIKTLISDFVYKDFDATLIQIALPRLYRDKPLFNIPLYHELGHFIDTKYQVSKFATLLKNPNAPVTAKTIQELRHREEYFADLFAACYVGKGSCQILNLIAPNSPETSSHPATDDRIAIVNDFLQNKPNSEISLLQSALQLLGQPTLKVRYEVPNVSPALDDIRPYRIQNDGELHGIFEAGLNYLIKARQTKCKPWEAFDDAAIDNIVNDLVEKSIRNMSILRKWKDATP